MSQKTTRASAREIRRAFGPAAVASLAEHDEALVHHAEQIRQHGETIDYHKFLLNEHGKTWRDLDARTHDHARALTEVRNDFYCRSVWGRLRWLFTGK